MDWTAAWLVRGCSASQGLSLHFVSPSHHHCGGVLDLVLSLVAAAHVAWPDVYTWCPQLAGNILHGRRTDGRRPLTPGEEGVACCGTDCFQAEARPPCPPQPSRGPRRRTVSFTDVWIFLFSFFLFFQIGRERENWRARLLSPQPPLAAGLGGVHAGVCHSAAGPRIGYQDLTTYDLYSLRVMYI